MAALDQAIAYILKHYPYKDDLSNARVTKMLYLADWFNAKNGKRRVTNIKWYFDNYGPFVWDVKRAAENSDLIKIVSSHTMFGDPKDLFKLSDLECEPNIDQEEKAALDHVIEQTKSLGWSAFIKLVYSTYPVASSAKYTYLNLERLAADAANMGDARDEGRF